MYIYVYDNLWILNDVVVDWRVSTIIVHIIIYLNMLYYVLV